MAQMASGNGFNPFKYAYDCSYLFRNAVLPKDLVIDFDGNTNLATLAGMFFNTSGVENLTLRNLQSEKTNLAANAFIYISQNLKTITFDNCDFAPVSFESFGRSCPNLTTVNGLIDCSNCKTGTAMSFFFGSSTNLVDFRIKPNSISMTPGSNFGGSLVWSTASYVSLANGLNPNTAGTLTLISQQKAACSTIVGVVVDGVFIATNDGSITLADFITNTKGWTLA